MNREIYCPFCCWELDLKDGYLHCANGETTFAPIVRDKIMEAMKRVSPPDKVNDPPIKRIHYHCPNCRGELSLTKPGILGCVCGFEITAGMNVQLTEREVHKDVWKK